MNTVMDRHNQIRSDHEWSFMMGHVNDIDMLPLQSQRDDRIVSPESVLFGLIQLPEIGRQRSKFVEVSMRSDQKIFVSGIDRGNIADQIPDVGTYSELVDFPDVDRDPHNCRRGLSFNASGYRPRPAGTARISKFSIIAVAVTLI